MKKHTQLTLLIGIVFCHTSLSIASSNDNGPYSPAIVIPAIMHFVKASMAAAASHIIVNEIAHSWQKTKTDTESFWEYLTASKPKLATTTHEELQVRPDLTTNTLKSLPEKIQAILNNEQASGTGEHQLMLLYGLPGTGKTTLAQQIALYTGGNYYHVHQQSLDNYSDATVARFLRGYVETISHETADGKVSTLHLEEFGKQLGKSMQNDVHNLNHGKYENTWKDLLQDLEKKYPKVRVVACSNFGQDEKAEMFNSAIANERAHIVKIDAPNEFARKTYFASTCIAHLENQGIKQAQHQTQSAHTQAERNRMLNKEYCVTAAMHAAAIGKHEDKIRKLSTPWTLGVMAQPWIWSDVWTKNSAAQNLKAQGYFTPIVNHDLTKATKEQAATYASLTDGLRYRQLNEITESARIDKLAQIQRMKKRAAQSAPGYTIDIENRTFSLATQSESDGNSSSSNDTTITVPFGKIRPHDLVRAAAIQRKQNLHAVMSAHPKLKDKLQQEISTLPVTDIKSLAEKLVLTIPYNKSLESLRKEKAKAFRESVRNKTNSFTKTKQNDITEMQSIFDELQSENFK